MKVSGSPGFASRTNDDAIQFKKNRNHLPKRVIIYRNGCSEGQFTNVRNTAAPTQIH